jgi:hypothetical protein
MHRQFQNDTNTMEQALQIQCESLRMGSNADDYYFRQEHHHRTSERSQIGKKAIKQLVKEYS